MESVGKRGTIVGLANSITVSPFPIRVNSTRSSPEFEFSPAPFLVTSFMFFSFFVIIIHQFNMFLLLISDGTNLCKPKSVKERASASIRRREKDRPWPSLKARLAAKKHYPSKLYEKFPCSWCYNRRCGQRKMTKYHCEQCRVDLCAAPCFKEFHTEQKEVKDERTPPEKLDLSPDDSKSGSETEGSLGSKHEE